MVLAYLEYVIYGIGIIVSIVSMIYHLWLSKKRRDEQKVEMVYKEVDPLNSSRAYTKEKMIKKDSGDLETVERMNRTMMTSN